MSKFKIKRNFVREDVWLRFKLFLRHRVKYLLLFKLFKGLFKIFILLYGNISEKLYYLNSYYIRNNHG